MLSSSEFLLKKIKYFVGAPRPDFAKKEERIEEICAALIQEFGRQALSAHNSTFLPDHGPFIQATIRDASLRGRNVWVG